MLSIRVLHKNLHKKNSGSRCLALYALGSVVLTILIANNMSKRSAEELDGGAPLKAGQRPETGAQNEEGLDFEDEFEDEYDDSGDEVMEAGVDGRPDAEREAETKGMCKLP